MKNLFLVFIFLINVGYVIGQSNEFSGRVIDADGMALAGVSVRINGTNNGSSTNERGEYSFTSQIKQPVTLQFSLIGYITQDVRSEHANPLNITLTPSDACAL